MGGQKHWIIVASKMQLFGSLGETKTEVVKWPLGHLWEAGGERFNANVGSPRLPSDQIKAPIRSDQGS